MPNIEFNENTIKASMGTFMENVYLIVLCIKPDGTILYANPHFYKSTGYSKKGMFPPL